MSERHATGTDTSAPVDQLITDLEALAARLGDPDVHYSIDRHPTRWEVTVYVRPFEHPEVIVGYIDSCPYGYIGAYGDTLPGTLSAAIGVCQSVARDQAVPA